MADTVPGTEVAVTIRSYRPTDHPTCRALWAELTQQQRRLYNDPSIGGEDPGAAFEEYLTRLDLSGMWVADHAEDGVVGFVGLILAERSGEGEVEPVVVSEAHRHRGIGRPLPQVAGRRRPPRPPLQLLKLTIPLPLSGCRYRRDRRLPPVRHGARRRRLTPRRWRAGCVTRDMVRVTFRTFRARRVDQSVEIGVLLWI